MISLNHLLTTFSRAEALAVQIDYLQSEGFDTDAWQEGDIERTLITMRAAMASDMSDVVKLVSSWGFNDYATGSALNLFSKSRYNQEKEPARRTVGPIELTSTALVPYSNKAPGSIIFATDDGVEFELYGSESAVGASITIPAEGSVTAQIIARKAGAASNVAAGTLRLLTPLAGVTATISGSPWYTTSGRDEESDESMRERNATRWAEMTPELIALSYESIARGAGAGKVYVDDQNPRGAGTIDVHVSGETALLSDAEATAIQEVFAVRAFQTDSNWPAAADSRVSVEHPDTLELDVTATVYHDPAVTGAVMQTRLRAALVDFLRRTPVGGWRYLPDNDHVILVDDVAEVLRNVPGVITVVMSVPAATISVAVNEFVIEGDWVITPVAKQN